MLHQSTAQRTFNRLLRAGILFVILLATLFPPFGIPVAQAQAVPSACLNDAGQAVRPNPAYLDPGWSGAWVLILNFNHAPSASQTVGCVGMISKANPSQVTYRLIQCPLLNNVNQVTVGDGAANFDGNLWVQCPGITQNKYFHSSFGVWGRASFPVAKTTYALLSHPDVAVGADVDATWRITLRSRYGSTNFSNLASQSNVSGRIVRFKSEVDQGDGAHYINGNDLMPHAMTPGFSFDESQPLTIGAAGQTLTLYEILVDPPGRCCSGS